MIPPIITFFLLLLFAPSHGKRCSSKTSDIVKITVRNETRKEAGKDPVEEVIELKMCNGKRHLVDLKEENHLVAVNADVAELKGDDKKFREKMSKAEMKESCRCSYEGKLEEDPDSQVSLSGCPGSDEDEDGQILTLVTNKFKFRSSTYRLSKGKVEMAEGDMTDKVVVHRPAAPVEKNHGPRPDISGVRLPEISDKTVIDKNKSKKAGKDQFKTGGGILSKEENEPHIGGGMLSKEKQDYPEVSGHPHELLVQDSSNKWWLVVTSGNQDQDTAGGQHERRKDSAFDLPGVPGKASHTEVENGEDYKEATPKLKGEGVSELGGLDYKDFNELHKKTMKHWKEQQTKNKEELAKILESKDDVLVHEHSMQRRPTKGLPELYQRRTIEICVITDPFLFDLIKNLFGLKTDKDVNAKIFKTVHKTLMGAETFLKHKSISKIKGGFQLKLNGIRVLKDWGHLDKMKTRKNLQDVLFDLGDYMQVINNDWDGHKLSYDLAVLFTGKTNFVDGDGFAYIGGICQQDSPITLKMRFDNLKLNLNMGRLLAHEIGHALGANHDDDYPECRHGNHLMTSVVSNSMNTWSDCSARDIDKVVGERMADTNCLKL